MQSNKLKIGILLSEPLLVSRIYYLIGQCKTQTTDRAQTLDRDSACLYHARATLGLTTRQYYERFN